MQPAVIFDMDGVLIDSRAAHLASWRALAAELGCQVSAEVFQNCFGRQNRDVLDLLCGGVLVGDAARQAADRKEVLYRDLVRGRMPAMPGAVELVRACAADGLRLAVGTSAPWANVELVLAELGVAGVFEAVISEADVTRGKPDPQVFQLAAERLGVPPRFCAVIEDSPAGLAAADAAGMIAIGLAGTAPPSALAAARLVVSRLADLTPAGMRNLLPRRG